MDEAREATRPIRLTRSSNKRKRLISPTAETLSEAPQPKRVNQGCDENDSTDDYEIASLKAVLGPNENPDEALRTYL